MPFLRSMPSCCADMTRSDLATVCALRRADAETDHSSAGVVARAGRHDIQRRRAHARRVRVAAVDHAETRDDRAARRDATGAVIEFYPQIKYVHVAAVIASGVLFFVRGLGLNLGAGWMMAAPLRYLSYTIDTVLLTAALMLATILQ